MTRPLGLLAIVTVLLILALTRGGEPQSRPAEMPGPAPALPDASRAPAAASGLTPDAVGVEHRIVAVPAVVETGQAPRSRDGRAGAIEPVRTALAEAAPSDSPGVVSRAARILLGDGRHRPEPFPRPRR